MKGSVQPHGESLYQSTQKKISSQTFINNNVHTRCARLQQR